MRVSAILPFVSAAAAHYFFPDTVVGGVTSSDWQYIRKTDNDPVSYGVTDFTNAEMACFQNETITPSGQVLSIAAGTQIAFKSSNTMGHPGPQLWYMAKIPSGQNVNTWNPASQKSWFKISERGAINDPYVQFETNMVTPNTTIPKNLANGQYLLRFEHVALHLATPQFYIACAEVSVTNGGTGLPTTGLVSFPGVYQPSDPSFVTVYSQKAPYPYPGPAVAKI